MAASFLLLIRPNQLLSPHRHQAGVTIVWVEKNRCAQNSFVESSYGYLQLVKQIKDAYVCHKVFLNTIWISGLVFSHRSVANSYGGLKREQLKLHAQRKLLASNIGVPGPHYHTTTLSWDSLQFCGTNFSDQKQNMNFFFLCLCSMYLYYLYI